MSFRHLSLIAQRASLILPVLFSACSPVAVLNAWSPRSGITATPNVPYAAGERHGSDIYAPANARSAPVVVFFYGGRWNSGAKEPYRFVAAELARHGIVAVVPDYRLFPNVRFPAFLQDAAAAVAWVRTHISRYGGDPARLFLMGHSAGAYIAVMLALDARWLRAAGVDPDHALAGCIGLAGPYDFLPLRDADLQRMFAPAGDLRFTQPITYARGDAAPLLLATGLDDVTVRPLNTEHLAAAIARDHGRVEVQRYRGVTHVKLIGAFAAPLRWLAPVLRDTVDFIQRRSAFASDGRSASGTSATIVRLRASWD